MKRLDTYGINTGKRVRDATPEPDNNSHLPPKKRPTGVVRPTLVMRPEKFTQTFPWAFTPPLGSFPFPKEGGGSANKTEGTKTKSTATIPVCYRPIAGVPRAPVGNPKQRKLQPQEIEEGLYWVELAEEEVHEMAEEESEEED